VRATADTWQAMRRSGMSRRIAGIGGTGFNG